MTAEGVSTCKHCGRRIMRVQFSWGSMWMHRKLVSDDNYYEACPQPPGAYRGEVLPPFIRATPIEQDAAS